MRRFLAGVAALGFIAGCGGSGSDQMVRSGTAPVERKADGSLSSNPAPLTLEDVEKQPSGSAQRGLTQMIFWAQWGNIPAVVDVYHSAIRARLGVSRITGAYDYLRPELLTSQPRVISVRPSAGGQFISLEFASARGAPQREGFLMRRGDGAWRVVYDTLLERAVEAWTVEQEAPGDRTPSAAARRAGSEAAQIYRDAFPLIALAERAATPR